MKRSRRNMVSVKGLLAIFLSLVLSPLVFVLIIDPHQYLHKSFLHPDSVWTGRSRHQLSGIIKHYISPDSEFSTIVLGASLSLNYEPEVISKNLNTSKVMNLSFNTAYIDEQKLVVKKVLEFDHIDHLILSGGPIWFSDVPDNHKQFMPWYMFNTNPVDDVTYGYEFATLRTYAVIISKFIANQSFSDSFPSVVGFANRTNKVPLNHFTIKLPNDEISVDTRNKATFLSKSHKTKIDTFLAKHIDDKRAKPLKIKPYSSIPTSSYQLELDFIEEAITARPDVKIDILLTPISTLGYYGLGDKRDATIYRAKALLEHFRDNKNIRIFAIADADILNDIRNYTDMLHYDIRISRYYLSQVGNGGAEITTENVDAYTAELISTISSYDILSPYEPPITPRKINFDGTLNKDFQKL